MKLMIEEKYKKAQTRIKSWLEKRTFRPHKLREVLVGTIFTICLCEVACYKQLQSIVKSREVPAYVPDMIIVVMAMLETIVSPILSWLGSQKRRTMIVVLMPFITMSVISWRFLPDVKQTEESEFCHGSKNDVHIGVIRSTAVRLGITLSSCVLFVLARINIWCHGVAYIEEHGPDRVSLHMGILLFVRVIAYAIGHHMVGLVIKTAQIATYTVSFVTQMVQIIYFMPTKTLKEAGTEAIPSKDRHFLASMARVLSNPIALSQIICMALSAAAVWGYFYNATDIIKVKFLIFQSSDSMLYFTELFQYYTTLLAVLYIGLLWSDPIQTQFNKLQAMRRSFWMLTLVGVLFTALAITVTCEHGRVEGLKDHVYTNPNCSLDCGCTARFKEFSPVCVVDDMTTYLSPCQAGCEGVENIEGLMVYKNCTCSRSGRAVAGACSERGCGAALALQRMLHVLLLTFAVQGFQAQTALMLKAADPRDKSVVLGLGGTFVALFAFVISHIVYGNINASTCVWSASGRCHMNSPRLPLRAGAASAGTAFASAAICLLAYIYMRIREKRKTEATRM